MQEYCKSSNSPFQNGSDFFPNIYRNIHPTPNCHSPLIQFPDLPLSQMLGIQENSVECSSKFINQKYSRTKEWKLMRSKSQKCGRFFRTPYLLALHLKVGHKIEFPFSCPMCSQRFRSNQHCKAHLKALHSIDRCFQNGQFRSSTNYLKAQVLKYKCPKCSKKCCTKSLLQHHILTHWNQKPHECPMHHTDSTLSNPNISPGSESYLPTQTSQTTDEAEPEKNERLQRISKRKQNMGRETENLILIDPPIISLAEDAIEERVSNNPSTVCDKQLRPHACPTCGCRYRKLNDVRAHQQKQGLCESFLKRQAAKNFHCQHCDASFTQKPGLAKHLKIVHGLRRGPQPKHFCFFCGYEKITLCALESHMRIHTGEKPFTCICGAIFKHRGNFLTHQRQICSRTKELGLDSAIVPRTNVKKRRVRKAVEQFKCSKCDLMLLTPYLRRAHEMAHGVDFMCPYCPAGFRHKAGLIQHLLKLHAEEYANSQPVTRKSQLRLPILASKTEDGCKEMDTNLRGRLQCSKCPLTFRWDFWKRKHERTHGDEFTCLYCPTGFKTTEGIQSHLIMFHKEEYEKPDTLCFLCGLQFSSHVEHTTHDCIQLNNNNDKADNDSSFMIRTSSKSSRRSNLTDPLSSGDSPAHVDTIDAPEDDTGCQDRVEPQIDPLSMDFPSPNILSGPELSPLTCLPCQPQPSPEIFKAQIEDRISKRKQKLDKRKDNLMDSSIISFPENIIKEAEATNPSIVIVNDRRLRPHACPTCGCKYRKLADVRTHQLKKGACEAFLERRAVSKVYCPHCDGMFKELAGLSQHLRKIHGIRKRPQPKHICFFCGVEKISYCTLENHMRIHTGEKPFSCICGAIFKHRGNFLTHQRQICSQSKELGLDSRIDRSTNIKSKRVRKAVEPVKCSKCDLTLLTPYLKRAHEMAHGVDFMCPYCPTGFRHKAGLIQHQLKLHAKDYAMARSTSRKRRNITTSGTDFEKGTIVEEHLVQLDSD